jgi:hypothetical protein
VFDFEKDAAGAWTMKGLNAGETLDATKVADLLSRLSFLNMTRPLGKTAKPEYGLDAPAATITVTLKQENASPKPVVLRVGAQDASDNAYAVSSSESPYIVRVSSFTVEQFVTRSRQDFLATQPTPTPGEAAPGEASPTPAP